ncbi:MAG TPA: response regulator transcription factor [Gaiellaceae bacterium]|nr:response regulator transcription factor [Gaiellaceae bacterium]
MRVVIVEDSGLLRDALTRLLTDFDVEVAAAVATPEELLGAAEEHKPDVFVVDVRLPPTFTDEGVHAAAELRSRDPEAKVLLLSQAVEERYARELLAQRTEGLGYLLKDRVADGAEFVDALQRVAGGGTALDPEVVRQLLVRHRAIDELTPRERQVLELMAEGRTNAAIARALVVTDRAIEKHVASIFGKLRLPPSQDDHRRVLAVLAWLNAA